eukprot:84342_1
MDVDTNSNENSNTNNKENSNNSSNDPPTTVPKDVDRRYDVELTRAIKENHGTSIQDARLCPFEGGHAFLATVASNQVMVYDCEVRGNYIATLLNYRNWHLPTMRTKNIVWKENLEKHHQNELDKKSFNTICWMKRYKDFWIAAADNEQTIHLLSLTNAKCVQLIKTSANIIDLLSHPLYPNILCTIDVENRCRFINITTEETIYVLPDKIHQIRFSPSGNKFVAVLGNGMLREYEQSVEMVEAMDQDDDMKDEEDADANRNKNNSNRNAQRKANKVDKRLIVKQLNSYKVEDKGSDVADVRYCGESSIIIANEDGEFKMVNMGNIQLVHQWKVKGHVETGNMCRFDVNQSNDCVVYGNADQQVHVYDLKKRAYLRRVDTGRGRKFPFTFAMFCKHHPQSVMMVCDSIVMKFDPLELVKDFFPSTADFAVQKRAGSDCFPQVQTITYEADSIKLG